MREIILRLTDEMIEAVSEIAEAEDVTPGHIIRAAIEHEFGRRARYKDAESQATPLIAQLRALLAKDFAQAVDWTELDLRLAQKGFELSDDNGRLELIDGRTGARLCQVADIDPEYAGRQRSYDRAGVAGGGWLRSLASAVLR
jgi:hypothetical protein